MRNLITNETTWILLKRSDSRPSPASLPAPIAATCRPPFRPNDLWNFADFYDFNSPPTATPPPGKDP